MRFFYMSDLHLEFRPMDISLCPGTKNDVLLLAGDIGVARLPSTFLPFVKAASKQFYAVLQIPGNHEYYNGDFPDAHEQMHRDVQYMMNVRLDESFKIDLGDVRVIAATLWTDFFKRNPLLMVAGERCLADFHRIMVGALPMRAHHQADQHDIHKKFIYDEIKIARQAGKKVIVMTHHAPVAASCAPWFKGDILNSCFYSELEEDLLKMADEDLAPHYWIHGHVHHRVDATIGKTKVLANPRGYPNEVGTDFNINEFVEFI